MLLLCAILLYLHKPNNIAMIKYYTVTEAAALLSVNRETIARKIRAKEIFAVRLFGSESMIRIPETELSRLIKEGGQDA